MLYGTRTVRTMYDKMKSSNFLIIFVTIILSVVIAEVIAVINIK